MHACVLPRSRWYTCPRVRVPLSNACDQLRDVLCFSGCKLRKVNLSPSMRVVFLVRLAFHWERAVQLCLRRIKDNAAVL